MKILNRLKKHNLTISSVIIKAGHHSYIKGKINKTYHIEYKRLERDLKGKLLTPDEKKYVYDMFEKAGLSELLDDGDWCVVQTKFKAK